MANPPELPVAPKKKSKFKLIMVLIALLLLIGGGAGGFWWFTMRDPGSPMPTLSSITGQAPAAQEGSAPQTPAKDAPAPKTSTRIVSLPTVTVNLADTASARYLKVGMDVEVTSDEAVTEIQSQTPRIRDAIIILLSSKSYAELATAEGKLQLKNEVASRLNQILGTPRVVRIYFTDFVVQ